MAEEEGDITVGDPTEPIREAVRPWLDLIDTLRAQGVQQVCS